MDGQRWVDLFAFAAWLVEWLAHVQSWGGSCICHQLDYEAGNAVERRKKNVDYYPTLAIRLTQLSGTLCDAAFATYVM